MTRQRPPIDGGTILITGASAGIGRELARQLARRARTLVLVARRTERLKALEAELQEQHSRLLVHIERCDLGDAAAVDRMTVIVRNQLGEIDVLVNNAGVGHQRLYDRADWARIEEVLRVNVVAPALLTHRLVPSMVARGRGGILNIGSGAGFALMPGNAVYVGSKHFLNGFTETLRLDLEGTGVVVTQVCPGPVDTEFNEAAGITEVVGGPPRFVNISAAHCAREAIAGFDQGRPVVFPGLPYRVLMSFLPFIPRPLQRLALRPAARRLRETELRGKPGP